MVSTPSITWTGPPPVGVTLIVTLPVATGREPSETLIPRVTVPDVAAAGVNRNEPSALERAAGAPLAVRVPLPLPLSVTPGVALRLRVPPVTDRVTERPVE